MHQPVLYLSKYPGGQDQLYGNPTDDNQMMHIPWIYFLVYHRNQRQFRPKAFRRLLQRDHLSGIPGFSVLLFYQYKDSLLFQGIPTWKLSAHECRVLQCDRYIFDQAFLKEYGLR